MHISKLSRFSGSGATMTRQITKNAKKVNNFGVYRWYQIQNEDNYSLRITDTYTWLLNDLNDASLIEGYKGTVEL
jgi:hypothetical protein